MRSRLGISGITLAASCVSLALVVALPLAGAGCAYDWNLPTSTKGLLPGSGDDGAAAGQGQTADASVAATSSSDGGADAKLAADGSAATHDASDASDGATAGDASDASRGADASDASVAPKPACSPATPCAAGTYCHYDDNYCGAGAPGTCVKIPASCDNPKIEAACGCNGTTYTSRCGAAKASQDLSTIATCQAPPDYRRCGYLFCGAGDYCLQEGTTYSCEPLSGCVLGCVCTGLLSACGGAGGACSSENGGIKVKCN